MCIVRFTYHADTNSRNNLRKKIKFTIIHHHYYCMLPRVLLLVPIQCFGKQNWSKQEKGRITTVPPTERKGMLGSFNRIFAEYFNTLCVCGISLESGNRKRCRLKAIHQRRPPRNWRTSIIIKYSNKVQKTQSELINCVRIISIVTWRVQWNKFKLIKIYYNKLFTPARKRTFHQFVTIGTVFGSESIEKCGADWKQAIYDRSLLSQSLPGCEMENSVMNILERGFDPLVVWIYEIQPNVNINDAIKLELEHHNVF